MRLDKYIASVTDLSRKQVRQAVRSRQVCVNGVVMLDPSSHVDAGGEVRLAGETLRRPGLRYLMMHKPAGIICATRDSHQTTVIDLLEIERTDALQIAGRLDIDATGLVLLTDDGQWNHRLTSPRHGCEKVYLVSTAEPLKPAYAEQFQQGIYLRPENYRCRPAALTILSSHQAELRIAEGRYHQVKRMFAALGNRVTALHRSAVGDITLDPLLEPGQYRTLGAAEVASI